MGDMNLRRQSAWNEQEVTRFLEDTAIPLRLAFTDSNNAPAITPLWFLFRDQVICCATQRSSHTVSRLRESPLCGFDISVEQPPYYGVRGQAEVEIDSAGGGELLAELIDRYLGSRDSDLARWLLARTDEEVALVLRPRWISAWDFRHRMPKKGG